MEMCIKVQECLNMKKIKNNYKVKGKMRDIKKNCLVVISLFFIIFCLGFVNAATTIYVNPSSQSVVNGSSFKVNVSINTDENAYGAQFDLYFNASILEVSSVSEGDFFKQGASTFFSGGSIDNVNGKINDVYITRTGTQTGVSGTGSIAEITFNTKNPGTSYLNLDDVKATKIAGGNIIYITGIVVNNGSVSVTSAEFISITFIGSPINFGSLNPGEQGAGLGNPYIIRIEPETSVNVDIYQKGNDYTGAGTITIDNMKWNSVNNAGSATSISSTYVSPIFSNKGIGDYDIYYWLNIPGSKPAGTYASTIYIKAVKTGESP